MIKGIGGGYAGLSSDQKPTAENAAAWFIETDTNKVFIWNGASWVEKTSGGGGGGVAWRLAARWHDARTFSNIGTAFVDVFNVGLNGQRQPVDFAGFAQSRFVVHWNNVGGSAHNVRIWDGTNVLHDLSASGAGEKEMDSGWVNLPVGFSSELLLRVQAKAAVAGDDPVFRGASLYLK